MNLGDAVERMATNWTTSGFALPSAEALVVANALRTQRCPAQVDVRCAQGCGLLKAWQLPSGILVWHPSVRINDGRGRDNTVGALRAILASRLSSSGTSGVLSPCAYVIGQSGTLPLLCEHHSDEMSLDELRLAVRESLRCGAAQRVVRKSPTR